MKKILLSLSILLTVSVSAFATTHQVSSADDLIRSEVHSACASSDTITLTTDIDMSGKAFSPMCSNGFAGVFDGNGHTISNLHISADIKHTKDIAFVSIIKGDGILRNLTFDHPRIDATQSNNGHVSSSSSVAVVVGELNGGSVVNVHVMAGVVDLDEGIHADGIAAGGFIGTAKSGTVSESSISVDIVHEGGSSIMIGGFCGNVTADGDASFLNVTYEPYKETKYGAVTIIEKNSVKSAVINGSYTGADTIKFASDVAVSSVEFTRTFTPNTMSTVMLPFSIDTSKVKGGKIYRFKRVDVNEETGAWKVVIGRIYTEQVGANTPYLVLPTADKMTFEGPVTFNTTTDSLENAYGLEEGSSWEFKGVYAYTEFAQVEEDGPIYAFAGQERSGAKVGQFVSADNAKSYPMCAYLVNHQGNSSAKSSLGQFGHSFTLPDVVDVEIENENGVAVETGRLNTVTGDVRMDRWFDLKGRKLNAKPTAKGTYYKNGKRVVIK